MSSILLGDDMRHEITLLKRDPLILAMFAGLPEDHLEHFFSGSWDSISQAHKYFTGQGGKCMRIGSAYDALKALYEDTIIK